MRYLIIINLCIGSISPQFCKKFWLLHKRISPFLTWKVPNSPGRCGVSTRVLRSRMCVHHILQQPMCACLLCRNAGILRLSGYWILHSGDLRDVSVSWLSSYAPSNNTFSLLFLSFMVRWNDDDISSLWSLTRSTCRTWAWPSAVPKTPTTLFRYSFEINKIQFFTTQVLLK